MHAYSKFYFRQLENICRYFSGDVEWYAAEGEVDTTDTTVGTEIEAGFCCEAAASRN